MLTSLAFQLAEQLPDFAAQMELALFNNGSQPQHQHQHQQYQQQQQQQADPSPRALGPDEQPPHEPLSPEMAQPSFSDDEDWWSSALGDSCSRLVGVFLRMLLLPLQQVIEQRTAAGTPLPMVLLALDALDEADHDGAGWRPLVSLLEKE
eukprot:365738-Chlamydomonas_euryale.AAC.14